MHQDPVTTSDAALVRDIASGREQALLDVIAEHGSALLGLARRMVKSTQLAEEITQDVFVTLWQRADRFDPTRGSLEDLPQRDDSQQGDRRDPEGRVASHEPQRKCCETLRSIQ